MTPEQEKKWHALHSMSKFELIERWHRAMRQAGKTQLSGPNPGTLPKEQLVMAIMTVEDGGAWS